MGLKYWLCLERIDLLVNMEANLQKQPIMNELIYI